jgi:hypothetical protein
VDDRIHGRWDRGFQGAILYAGHMENRAIRGDGAWWFS